MSSFSLDKHLFCMKCQGSECSMNSRCDECMQWTKEEMEKYVKLCKSFSSKRKRSKSSPPRSIPHDRDADVNLATQLDSIQKSVDDKIETMSINLMSRFSSMLDNFQAKISNTSCSDSSAVLGYSATSNEPVSRRPTDRTKCPMGLRFRKGREDPVPQEDIISCEDVIDETPETLGIPGDAGEPQAKLSAPAFVRHNQAGAGFDSQPDDDDDDNDDRDSGADSAPSDKTYIRLMCYIHDSFPHSEPASAPREPPRCEFEEFFSTSEASSSAKPTLTLYPPVSEILDSCTDRAAQFAKESKPLHRVLPFKHKTTLVGDRPDFCVARYLNSDFSRIARQKTILKSRASSVSFADFEKLDRAS